MSRSVKGLLATDSPLCYHPSASVYHITFNSSLLEVSELEIVTAIRRHSFMRRVVPIRHSVIILVLLYITLPSIVAC